MIIELKKSGDFEQIVNKYKKVLIDFYATWCGPCKMLAPMLEKVNEKNNNLVILKIDIDKCKELVNEFQIQAVPTLVFLKEKKVVEKSMGFSTNSQIQKIIDEVF